MMKIKAFETTPNPDALKCVVEPGPGGGIRSYRAAGEAEAAGDELAARIFRRVEPLGGARSVLIHEAFITVVKSPGGSWSGIKKAIRAAVEGGD